MKNEDFGIDWKLTELKQRHIEKFSELAKAAADLSVPKYRGEIVRAAIEAEWFTEPKLKREDVGNFTAKAVRWISDQVADIYTAALEVDPK